MKNLLLPLSFGLALALSAHTHAEQPHMHEGSEKTASPDVFATVNGAPISVELYHFLLGSREQESSERQAYEEGYDVEMHRRQTAEDLIMTELLAQHATRLGMDESDMVKVEMAMAEKTLLAQLYVRKLMDSIEIDEPQIREAYDQKPEQVMYRFMIWQTPDQKQAKKLLRALEAGSGTVASEQTPIETPWLRDVDIAPEVDDIVRRLEVNEFAGEPVFQDGVWKVVQVIDKQVMAKQSYEEERELIEAELVRLKLDEKLEEIAEGASIVLNEQLVTGPME